MIGRSALRPETEGIGSRGEAGSEASGQDYTDEEEEIIRKRLEDLGYL